MLWGKYKHVFEVENTLTNQGAQMNVLPGIMKPNFNYSLEHTPFV